VSELGYEMASSAPAAGWYPDPADPTSSRWWSGAAWTDHVQPAAVAAVPVAAVPVAVTPAAPVMPGQLASPALLTESVIASAAPVTQEPVAPRTSNLDADGVPLNLFADSVLTPAVFAPAAGPATQSDWHNQTGRGTVPKRQAAGSVSLSTSVAAARDPYERNWIAGVALLFAILSIPALGARVLVELPPLTQSIFAGAPIAISLLALVVSVRRGNGAVLSIIAIVISGAVLAAGLLMDPAQLKAIVDSVVALLP
jgi:hypothetical protein